MTLEIDGAKILGVGGEAVILREKGYAVKYTLIKDVPEQISDAFSLKLADILLSFPEFQMDYDSLTRICRPKDFSIILSGYSETFERLYFTAGEYFDNKHFKLSLY